MPAQNPYNYTEVGSVAELLAIKRVVWTLRSER